MKVNPALASPDGKALSREEKQIQKLQQQLRELTKTRQNLWEKIDDSVLAVEALSETIELLKQNFLHFEKDPQAKDYSQSQSRLTQGFDAKVLQAGAVLKQLRALKGKAESTSGLVSCQNLHIKVNS
jgi:predicted  nucleic acid-binding Zn-ribbon protein